MRKSIKEWLLELFLLWPAFTVLLMSIALLVNMQNQWVDTWQEVIGYMIYYGLGSMIKQFFLYLQNLLLLVILRRIFFRFIALSNKTYVVLCGAISGTFSFFFCHWFNQSVERLYENIFEEYYFAFGFTLIGGLFFLLGQRRKIKTEAL